MSRVFVCVVFAASMISAAFADSADVKTALDAKIPVWLKQFNVPSASVAYVNDGALAWTAAYGAQSPRVAATTNTLYNIASLTKPITAETVLRLASAGKLSLDEPMSTYWIDPDIREDPRHKMLTPRLGLLHKTGFPNWRYDTNNVLAFQFDPGAKSQYSGEGFQYVARFAQAKLGQPFDALAQVNVLDRTGMTSTSFRKRAWFEGRVAIPQGPEGKPGEAQFQKTWNAADDVYATAGDYARFILSVMRNEGVSEAIARERLTIVDEAKPEVCGEGKLNAAQCPESVGFGLGWAAFKYKGETVVTHGGSDWGVKTYAMFVPERRMGAVVLTNGENGMKVVREVVGALYANEAYLAVLTLQAR